MPRNDVHQPSRDSLHLSVLHGLARKLAHPLEPKELLRTLHDEASRLFDTTIVILGLYDEVSQMVEVVGQVIAGEDVPGGSFPLGSGFTSQVIRTRESRLIRHWSKAGPRVQVQYATGQPGLPESGMTVPLIFDDRVIGVLSVQSYEPEAYDESDLLTLEVIASQAAMAIESMRRSARLDVLLHRRVSELEAILAAMTDALLIVDGEGRIVRLNNAARVALALEQVSVVLGQPLDKEQWGLWPLGAREVAEALEPIIAALRRGEARSDVEVEFRGGERRVFSFSCAPLHDVSGAPAGGVVVFRDVTERRVIERMKDEILGIASHDLKNPVTTIKGHAQILRRRLTSERATTADIINGLTVIIRQSDRLVELLDLLLDLSRLEAGRLELHPVLADLVSLTRAIVESVQSTTERHQLVLKAPERVEGVWDYPRLEQVLHNLLANAVKYSPKGGLVEVSIETNDGHVSVRVSDPGVGLAPEDLQRVFERFYRAEGTRRLEGAGLGLYICQGIIAAHGGRIWAESAGPGSGSTFCFTIPRKSPASTALNRDIAPS